MAEHTGTVIVDAWGCTHPGQVRERNEDSYLIGDLDTGEVWQPGRPFHREVTKRGPLWVVCDGLGGAAAGHVASKLAAEVIWSEMREAQHTDNRAIFARLLRRAVRVANRRVWEESRRDDELGGMGTTVSAAGLVGDALILAQVGDSRAYIQRGDSLVQVTRDQSVVSALVSAGRVSVEQARSLPESNMVLQALGIRQDIEVALSIVALRRGDRLLLCSDGLHGPVSEDTIAALLQLRADPADCADRLIAAACAAGGPDNITAVVAHLSGDGLHPSTGDHDTPRFIELDPMEEGARALATTSLVARRLAARAGLVDDPGGPVVPATSQHPVIRKPAPGSGKRPARKGAARKRRATEKGAAKQSAARAAAEPVEGSGEPAEAGVEGPATAALAERSRPGAITWIAIAAAVAVAAILVWSLLG